MTIQVNVSMKVNGSEIRKVTHNDREHWVLPSYTLPAGVVMNGILYPQEEIDKHYQSLEGKFAPLGHPHVNGQFISASRAEAINGGFWVGAWNQNVKKAGSRIYKEIWIDIEAAKKHDRGEELLSRIEAISNGEDVPPIHTSVAVFLREEPVSEEVSGGHYNSIARIEGMDHDAILLDEVGAATPEQGVGLMVNAESAVNVPPVGVLPDSYWSKSDALREAAKEAFITDDDKYVWVEDFNDTHAILSFSGSIAKIYQYSMIDSKIVFDMDGKEVVKDSFWKMAANKVRSFLSNPQPKTADVNSENDAMTPEQMAELEAKFGSLIANAVQPIADKVSAIEQNVSGLSADLKANQDAEAEKMRKAVAEKHGEIVANSLQGEALASVYRALGDAGSIAANSANSETGEFVVPAMPKFEG